MRVVSVSGFDQDNPDAAIEKYQTPAPEAPKDDEKDIVGFDALELDYSVPFPLSLVISRKTVLRYQLLFRYLLSLRHLETLLVSCWQDHSKIASWTHKSSNPKIELWKRRAFTLRARMLVFVQQLLYFCTAEVIEPNWQNLMARVDTDGKSTNGKQVVNRTVDELMQDHVDFLDTCLKECMLTQGKLLKVRAPRNRSTS
jgi:gamma-tubulin complex component 2